mgnify:CR=1 FL=1
MTDLINGKEIAQNLRNELKQEIDDLKINGDFVHSRNSGIAAQQGMAKGSGSEGRLRLDAFVEPP